MTQADDSTPAARALARIRQADPARPFVVAQLGQSLDGRIATASGESQWITGPEARRHVHLLRLRHDAIMVGGGTARADRPSLNVRGFGPVRQPERIVVSSRDLPDLPPEGPDFGPLHRVSGDPVTIMRELAQRGLTRIICEGGGNLAASLLSAGLVDDLVLYSAGMVLGVSGRPAVGALDFGPLADAPRFKLRKVLRLGPDLCQIWSRN